jgi:hypothetical protein
MSIDNVAFLDVSKTLAKRNIITYQTNGNDDKGIDAYFEIPTDSKQSGIFLAAQIKGGNSYIKQGNRCYVYDPEKKHIDLWLNFHLPVFLFVYDPDDDKTYWIDLQKYIISNPQQKSKGFSFDFNKEGAELSPESVDELIRYTKSKLSIINNPYSKAEYYYDLFESLSKKYKDETQYTGNISLQKSHIRTWLKQIGVVSLKEGISDVMIDCIFDYYHGLGVLGRLFIDEQVRKIFVFKNRLFIHTLHGRMSFSTQKINFDSCFKYFKNFIVDTGSGTPIARVHDAEILLHSSPPWSEESLSIFFPTKFIELHTLNENGQIPSSVNEMLHNFIHNFMNILVIGGSHSDKNIIISALTAFFSHNESVALVEDRKSIYVKNGNVSNFVANTYDDGKMLNLINKALQLEPDRIIFDIGNFQPFEQNFLPSILNIFSSRKGCIASINLVDSWFRQEITEGFELFSKTYYIDNPLTLNHVDVIITTADNVGYITSIWKKAEGEWKKVYDRPNTLLACDFDTSIP